MSEFIATQVLEPARRANVLARSKDILRRNLGIIARWIEADAARLSFIPPKARGMAFVSYRMDVPSRELVERLREEKSVFPVPGSAFGLEHYLRIGIGSSAEHLEEGLRRIRSFFDERAFALRAAQRSH